MADLSEVAEATPSYIVSQDGTVVDVSTVYAKPRLAVDSTDVCNSATVKTFYLTGSGTANLIVPAAGKRLRIYRTMIVQQSATAICSMYTTVNTVIPFIVDVNFLNTHKTMVHQGNLLADINAPLTYFISGALAAEITVFMVVYQEV